MAYRTKGGRPRAATTPGPDTPLLPKQEEFIRHFFAFKCSATKAAQAAGIHKVTAWKYMQLPQVIAAMGTLAESRLQQVDVDAEQVLRETVHIAFSDVRLAFGPDGALLDPQEWPDSLAAAVAGLDIVEERVAGDVTRRTKKLRLWPKVAAIELLMRNMEMLREIIDVRVHGQVAHYHRAVPELRARAEEIVRREFHGTSKDLVPVRPVLSRLVRSQAG